MQLPEVAKEISGEFEHPLDQVLRSLSFGLCPITGFVICHYPDDCPGCIDITDEMLRSVLQ
ncbi:MAG: hypothetical protein V1934_08285 [Methanobacteriota archaeon]